MKQALAAVGQARLMSVYQKIFAEYNQVCAQILMTKDTITNDTNRKNAKNTVTADSRMVTISPCRNMEPYRSTFCRFSILRVIDFPAFHDHGLLPAPLWSVIRTRKRILRDVE